MATKLTAEKAREHVERLEAWFSDNESLANFGMRANGDLIDPDGDDVPFASDEMVNGIDEIIEVARQVTEFLVELRRLKRFFEWAKTMPEWESELPE